MRSDTPLAKSEACIQERLAQTCRLPCSPSTLEWPGLAFPLLLLRLAFRCRRSDHVPTQFIKAASSRMAVGTNMSTKPNCVTLDNRHTRTHTHAPDASEEARLNLSGRCKNPRFRNSERYSEHEGTAHAGTWNGSTFGQSSPQLLDLEIQRASELLRCIRPHPIKQPRLPLAPESPCKQDRYKR